MCVKFIDCWAFLESRKASWLSASSISSQNFRTSETQSGLGMLLLTIALTCNPCVCELKGCSMWNLSVPLVCVEKALWKLYAEVLCKSIYFKHF